MTQGTEQGVNATLVAVRNGPGARLRAGREAIGFSQLEVAQQLRLSPEMIARLEEDNYDPKMPLVFVKGYLRSYSGLVGIDPEQVITEFGHLGINDPVRDVPDLAQSPQRKLSNFNSSAPKHRPGLLWGSLALFACGMLVFMWAYRDQIPALNTPAAVSSTNTSSTEENELNAALEAARQANAQAAAAANTPATPAPGQETATPPAAVTATDTPAAIAAPATPVVNATATAKKAAVSSRQNNEDDEDNAEPVKPMSANSVVVPKTRAAVKASAKQGRMADKTHETMLF